MFAILFMTTESLLIHQMPTRTSLDAIDYRDEYLSVS